MPFAFCDEFCIEQSAKLVGELYDTGIVDVVFLRRNVDVDELVSA